MIGISAALSFSSFSMEENTEDENIIVKADVIMPTKVSRPGCEEIDKMLCSISNCC